MLAVRFAGFTHLPFRLEQRKCLLGAPITVGNDCDGVAELDDLQHAAPALHGPFVDMLELAARHRAGIDRGIDHAGDLRIDCELSGAVDFERRVELQQRLAD